MHPIAEQIAVLLNARGHHYREVLWVGLADGSQRCSWEEFEELLEEKMPVAASPYGYTDFGRRKHVRPRGLVVVGDGWWVENLGSVWGDGYYSAWWVFCEPPTYDPDAKPLELQRVEPEQELDELNEEDELEEDPFDDWD